MAKLIKSKTPSSNKNRWGTQWECFNDAQALTDYAYMLDVCAEPATTKCANFLSPWGFQYGSFKNALTVDWVQELRTIEHRFNTNVIAINPIQKASAIWCNPPFDDKFKFIELCTKAGKTIPATMLLPYERNTTWWRKYIEGKASRVFLPDGRYNFYETDGRTKKSGVNFASCFINFEPGYFNHTQYIDFNRGIAQGKPQLKLNFAA
jgi:hypothetical protein